MTETLIEKLHQSRDKKERFVADMLKLSVDYGMCIDLNGVTDIREADHDRMERFYNNLLWWREDARKY